MTKETRELTCINCPLGCALQVTLRDGKVTSVAGNTCPRGEAYGKKEVTNPTRIVTSTVRVTGGVRPVASGKTREDVPKGAIFDITNALAEAEVSAPVNIGDVLVEDIAGTGVDFVATSRVDTVEKARNTA